MRGEDRRGEERTNKLLQCNAAFNQEGGSLLSERLARWEGRQRQRCLRLEDREPKGQLPKVAVSVAALHCGAVPAELEHVAVGAQRGGWVGRLGRRLPGRIGHALVLDGVFACRPPRNRTVLRVAAVPTTRATVAPAELLGGATDLVSLPERAEFDRWVRQGRCDAQKAAASGAFAALTPLTATSGPDDAPGATPRRRAARSPRRQHLGPPLASS